MQNVVGLNYNNSHGIGCIWSNLVFLKNLLFTSSYVDDTKSVVSKDKGGSFIYIDQNYDEQKVYMDMKKIIMFLFNCIKGIYCLICSKYIPYL